MAEPTVAGTDAVTMWFDPGCPFTWRTSRWLHQVAAQREITLDWRFMSLTVLNEGKPVPEKFRERRERAYGMLRVLVAARKHGGDEVVGPLYSALGSRVHDQGRTADRELLVEALDELGLPTELADAAQSDEFDAEIRAGHEESQARVGDAAGSPVVAVGEGRGFFGPVVVPFPTGTGALRLFDAVVALSEVPEFSELKTSRNPF